MAGPGEMNANGGEFVSEAEDLLVKGNTVIKSLARARVPQHDAPRGLLAFGWRGIVS